MSNQFSYELDERQIRLMMLNSESEYNEVVWERFETTISTSCKSIVKSPMPKVNISISRSFIIPVLFIGLIGGLSILLFSFVDLKKKEDVITEKPLIIPKPVIKPKTIATKPAVKPQVSTVPIVSKPVEQKSTANNLSVSVPNPTSKVVIEPSAKDIKPIELPKKNEVTMVQKPNTTSTNVKTPELKSKRKKKAIVVEELPVIVSPVNLTSSSEEEPELDLK